MNSPDGAIAGVGRFRLASADAGRQFTYVASLGIATPESINGATRVSAEQVAELSRAGRHDRRHAHAEGIRERAHSRRDARAVRREEPEGDRLRRQEGRLQRPEDVRRRTSRSSSSATARSAGSRTRPRAPRSPRATPRSTGSAAACRNGARSTCRSKALRPRRLPLPSCRRLHRPRAAASRSPPCTERARARRARARAAGRPRARPARCSATGGARMRWPSGSTVPRSAPVSIGSPPSGESTCTESSDPAADRPARRAASPASRCRTPSPR